jgi:peptidoglycan/xylan/chitin deacetylase (PgdA/CDA1 family)
MEISNVVGMVSGVKSDLAQITQKVNTKYDPVEDLINCRQVTAFPRGKGLVAIRFDDQVKSVYDNAFPVMKARGIPGTMSFVADGIGAYPNYEHISNALQAEMCHYGWELACHSYTHQGTPITVSDITHEIIESKYKLETDIGYNIRNFVLPGSWDNALKRDTLLGKAIMAHYTYSEGYLTAAGTTLPNFERFGVNHQTGDNATVAQIKAWIDSAAAWGNGQIILFHMVGQDGAGITTANFTEVCDYIKTLRDAGAIEVVTDSGLLSAQIGTSFNHVYNGGFETVVSDLPVGWNVVSTPSIVTDTPKEGTNRLRCTPTAYVTKELYLHGVKSGSYRLSVWHRTASSGTGRLMLEITGKPIISVSGASSGTDAKLELNFSIPKDIGKVKIYLQPSGGTVDYDDVQLIRI